ncbi:MAG: DUF294 nucleotidyltransferase-like domain-containing protein [Syntrophorhabdaceae bacterium]|nr:DUF294 nucleotidyltransferase-like domain-containing protein [Syntrophorhabdaceae bacterium]
MTLDVLVFEELLSKYRELSRNRGSLRHDKYRLLLKLKEEIDKNILHYENFEKEVSYELIEKIKKASTYEELLKYHNLGVDRVVEFFQEENNVFDVHELLRFIRHAITIKVLKLVEEEMEENGFGPPPSEYVWIGLGSEGRDEQTVMTDQDNMIIYGPLKKNGNGTDQEKYFEAFSNKAVERLDGVGFVKCKGGVMPSNPKWRGSIETWKMRIDERMVYERGDFEALDLIILTDAMPITGNEGLLKEVMDFYFTRLVENKFIMRDFIRSAVLMPTAITFFGNFKTEKSGQYKGMFNLKLLGWAPLILSVRMLALTNEIFVTNTVKRLQSLGEKQVIKAEMEADLIDAYQTFVRFRIANQILKRDGHSMNLMDTNYISPDMRGKEEQEKMRKAMKSVEALQKFMEETLLFGQPM